MAANEKAKISKKIRTKLVKRDESDTPVEVVEREYEQDEEGNTKLLGEEKYEGEKAKIKVEKDNK